MTDKNTYLVVKRLDNQTYKAILTKDGTTPHENTAMTICISPTGATSILGGEFFPDADLKMEALFLMKWMSEIDG